MPVLLPVLVALLFTAACGSSPSAPTPTPIPVPIPTPTPAPTVPLPTTDPRFDLAFYNQLVHNTYDAPGAREPLRRLTQSPSIYLQRTGLSDGFVAQLQQTARDTIPAFTGNALSLAAWETGTDARPEADGWIVVEQRNDEAANCGFTYIGQSRGHMWLNTIERCRRNGEPVSYAAIFAHELGHALGFWHDDAGLMHPPTLEGQTPTDRERYHGAVAYQQPVGSVN